VGAGQIHHQGGRTSADGKVLRFSTKRPKQSKKKKGRRKERAKKKKCNGKKKDRFDAANWSVLQRGKKKVMRSFRKRKKGGSRKAEQKKYWDGGASSIMKKKKDGKLDISRGKGKKKQRKAHPFQMKRRLKREGSVLHFYWGTRRFMKGGEEGRGRVAPIKSRRAQKNPLRGKESRPEKVIRHRPARGRKTKRGKHC